MDLIERGPAGAKRHPWETTRARFFIERLRERGVLTEGLAVLDAGAGDGYFAARLATAMGSARTGGADGAGGEVLGWDANYSTGDLAALANEAPRGLRFSRDRPPGRFGLVTALDVLEHVADDGAFIRQLVADNLEPGGAVLLSVPAWPALFSRHDEALQHFRRYSPRALAELVERAGLTIELSGGLFHSLLAPRIATVAAERILKVAGRTGAPPNLGHWQGGAALTSALEAVLGAETRLSATLARRGLSVPGLSHWVLARN